MAKNKKTTEKPQEPKLTSEQKEFIEVHEENDKLHEEVSEGFQGLDAVNPPYPQSENIEAVKENSDLNKYRESTFKMDIDEVKSPYLTHEDFTAEFQKFQKKHGVYPTKVSATTRTLDNLHLRQVASDAQLNVVEGGEKDGEIKLSFGTE